MRATVHCLFDSAVLIAQRNLEVHHLFPGTLKSEVAGFDNTGMHWTHGDLMNFRTVHLEKASNRDSTAVVEADRL